MDEQNQLRVSTHIFALKSTLIVPVEGAFALLFTAREEFQESQQIKAFFSHQRHKRALIKDVSYFYFPKVTLDVAIKSSKASCTDH